MPNTEQIRKKQEFYNNLENSEPNEASENKEILLKNAYTTLIGLVNQIENQLGKIPVYKDSKSISTTFRRKPKSSDTVEVEAENESAAEIDNSLFNPFGMIIEVSSDLLQNYFDLEEFKAKIVETPLNQRRLIILDFAELKKLSSMEIGQLVNINEILKGEGTFAIAMHMNKQVEILLHMMGVDSMFLIVRDFNDIIERLVGSDEFMHLAGEQTQIMQTLEKEEDEEDTTKKIFEIKEKLNKVRGIEKIAPKHISKPIQKRALNKKSILSMAVLIILIILMGVIWIKFFSAISKPGMPTEEEINAHFDEFDLESQETE